MLRPGLFTLGFSLVLGFDFIALILRFFIGTGYSFLFVSGSRSPKRTVRPSSFFPESEKELRLLGIASLFGVYSPGVGSGLIHCGYSG